MKFISRCKSLKIDFLELNIENPKEDILDEFGNLIEWKWLPPVLGIKTKVTVKIGKRFRKKTKYIFDIDIQEGKGKIGLDVR